MLARQILKRIKVQNLARISLNKMGSQSTDLVIKS